MVLITGYGILQGIKSPVWWTKSKEPQQQMVLLSGWPSPEVFAHRWILRIQNGSLRGRHRRASSRDLLLVGGLDGWWVDSYMFQSHTSCGILSPSWPSWSTQQTTAVISMLIMIISMLIIMIDNIMCFIIVKKIRQMQQHQHKQQQEQRRFQST